jgi:hypothetical protein
MNETNLDMLVPRRNGEMVRLGDLPLHLQRYWTRPDAQFPAMHMGPVARQAATMAASAN